ncbi:MAG: hypothetical protein JSU92_07700 [Deltaproteobacteria bacterium]|nr:MAG: hypothetical protein JSU92_07700 [Deltaproteobacteria bacterium]
MLIRKLLILSTVLVTLLEFGLTVQAQEAKIPATTAKTITRTEDPVIMEGKLLPELMEKKIENLRLFAFSGGEFKPIPFQIDEKLPDGSYVLPQLAPGMCEGKDVSANDEDQGLFDKNDDLVFLVKDIGDRAAKSHWQAGYDKGMEIIVTDPLTDGKGYAYLLHFDSPPPPLEVDYVTTRPDGKDHTIIEAVTYTLGDVSSEFYYDYLSIVGNDGKKGPDLLDRLEKIRAKVKTRRLFLSIDFRFGFDVVTKTIPIAKKDGPVRIISRSKGVLDFKIIKIEASGWGETFYYYNHFSRPIILELPVSLDKFLSDFDLYGACDFTKETYGSTVYDPVNTGGALLDGKMGEAEKAMTTGVDHDWVLGTSPTMGTIFQRLFFPPEWLEHVNRGSYILDDETIDDEPEDNPGQVHVGYHFGNFVKCLSKGRHVYWEYYYFPEKFKWGEQDKILNILDNPVKTEAGPGIE